MVISCGDGDLNIDNNVWFRGNDCAAVLDYKDPKRAIKRHVDPEWQQTLEGLFQKGGTRRTHLEKYTLNDLNARWVSEPGLYDLASSSKLPAARAFRKWGSTAKHQKHRVLLSTVSCSCCKADRYMA